MKNTLIKKNKEKHLAFETPVYYTKTTFYTEQIPTDIQRIKQAQTSELI